MSEKMPEPAITAAAIVVLLAYQAGDLGADDYPAYERARAILSHYAHAAAQKLMERDHGAA